MIVLADAERGNPLAVLESAEITALRTGAATAVAAELGEVVAGKKPGRTSAEETIVFDSTGMALQDVAAAAAVYAKAVRTGRGLAVRMGE